MNDIDSILGKGLIKVPAKDDVKDNPYRKVAKFLFILGAEQASSILKSLTKEQIDKIVAELITIRSVEKDEAEKLLSSFAHLYNTVKHSYGGINTAKDILEKAFGTGKAAEILDSAVPEKLPKPFDYLEDTDNETLTALLKNELTSTKVLTLSQLPPQKAAQFIGSLSDDKEKKDIIIQMAQTRKIDTRVLLDISEAMKKKLAYIKTGNSGETAKINGKTVLINILKKLPPEAELSIIQSLKETEPEIAEEIGKNIFTINDITGISDKQMQKFLFKFDDELLMKIMRSKNPAIGKKILSNISGARAARLLEGSGNAPPLLKKDYDKAAADFIDVLRRVESSGEIVFARSEKDKFV